MVTLALETSTPRGGVALLRDAEIIFTETFTADRSHSSELFAVIEQALDRAEPPGRIVVGLGPGSYAGVRIAIAAAIGISLPGGAELLGVPSIAALAEGGYLAIGDARRGGYWIAEIRDGDLAAAPAIVTREEIEARIGSATVPVFSSEALGLPGVELRFPAVDRLARLAVENQCIWARGVLEPIYLRDPHITLPRSP
jgi:tRNA threonylcarbamoyl adenosine modification protein YeaZ